MIEEFGLRIAALDRLALIVPAGHPLAAGGALDKSGAVWA